MIEPKKRANFWWLTAVGAAAGVALLVMGARWSMPESLSGPVGEAGWTNRSRAWFTKDGFFPPEVNLAERRYFSWTGGAARLVLPHLDRSQAYDFTARVLAGRPARAPEPPLLTLRVYGAPNVTVRTSNNPQLVSITIPPASKEGAEVFFALSNTFLPGPADRRALGVVIDDVRLTPAAGHFRPSRTVMLRAGLAIGASVLGLLWCGFPLWASAMVTMVVASTFAWLLLLDGAFIGPFVERLVRLGLGVTVIGGMVGLARWRWPIAPARSGWATATGILLGASVLKLAWFGHPLATVGDAMFQVHRAQLVHAGSYFFTSVTPRPFFEFPYAIALYVTALPLWRFFPGPLDLAFLLRGLTIGADAFAGLAIYLAVYRQWNDRRAAFLCVLLWPLAVAPLEALCNANLTNVFGQSVFAAAMGTIAWSAAGSRVAIPVLIVACVLLAVAFLSHFSTLSIGVPLVCLVGALLGMAGGTAVARRTGIWAIVIALAAAGVSYGVYYSHPRFSTIYQKTLERVVSREGEAPTRSIVAPASTKLRRWLVGHTNDYGLPGMPMLLCAGAGAALLIRQRRRDGLTLILAGWALTWIGFTVMGVVSAIEMRANLAVAPVFVCLGAYGLAMLANRSRLGVAIAVVAACVIGYDGLRVLLMCLGRR